MSDWDLTEEIAVEHCLRFVVSKENDKADLLPEIVKEIERHADLRFVGIEAPSVVPSNPIVAKLSEVFQTPGQPLELQLGLGRLNVSGAGNLADLLDSQRATADAAVLRRPVVGICLDRTSFSTPKAALRFANGLSKCQDLAYLYMCDSVKDIEPCATALTSIDVCAGELQSNLNLVETDITGGDTDAQRFLSTLVSWNRDGAYYYISKLLSAAQLDAPDIDDMKARRYGIAQVLRSEKDQLKRRDVWAAYRKLTGEEPPPMARVGEITSAWNMQSSVVSFQEKKMQRLALRNRL